MPSVSTPTPFSEADRTNEAAWQREAAAIFERLTQTPATSIQRLPGSINRVFLYSHTKHNETHQRVLLAVQLAFSYTASNAAVKIAKGGWLESVWRITWKPMLGSLLCAVALGFMFDTFVPNANTMVDVVRVLTS